ncbi:MAG: glycerol kinase GlpK, partial [Candidatus Dormibacteraeota bacterium]|nr:glycerol kinase GlpK [Candidatus Dormibacteraeota bacterium]
QGTSGTTALLMTPGGDVRHRAHVDVTVAYPRDGWVQQDALELWRSVQQCCDTVVRDSETAPVALGITNQRETLVVFDRRTLEPVAPAIVWQDRRTADICQEHRRRGEEPELRRRTGLLLDPYFTATKIEWLLREDPSLQPRAARGELCAGTVDTWLLARMTNGEVVATDVSNASRTLLFDIGRGVFDDALCEQFRVPPELLPEVRGSAEQVGTTSPDALCGLRLPVSGIAGDQQAALFGQACLDEGMSKNTYGTGSFVLTNVGGTAPDPGDGLLATIAWRIGGATTYALEGGIFVTGAGLRWLAGTGVIDSPEEAGALFDSVSDAAGCFFVPALSGLGAPWWDPQARGAFVGLTGAVGRPHLVRAVVEAMAYRTRDVVEAMERASGIAFQELRVDGGAITMDGLCQFQADVLGIPVARSSSAEATAMGAAMLAAVGEGLTDVRSVAERWVPGRRFEPALAGTRPSQGYALWLDALRRVRSQPGSLQ